MITVKCKRHPKYKGIYAPRVNCIGCNKIYTFTSLGDYLYSVTVSPKAKQ